MDAPAFPSFSRLQAHILFLSISAVFVASQALLFHGFTGYDDLHYAWLSAKVLQGTYSPFRIDDIFSGRMLLVAIQATVYKIGGISIFTTQLVSYSAVVLCCYVTVFHLLHSRRLHTVLVASSLFYFNPVLAGITLGPSPDTLVMLSVSFLLVLLNKAAQTTSKKRILITGAACGSLIFFTLLIKESALLFLPFAILIGWMQFGKNRFYGIAAIVAAFSFGILGISLLYKYYTGDFLFRVRQIQYSFFPNPCYYTSFFSKAMAVRLTYGVWYGFMEFGFYPILLAALVLLLRFTGLLKRNSNAKNEGQVKSYEKQFLILLVLALYFPFSLSNYQPLCFIPRHFLFLLPVAVVVCTHYFKENIGSPRKLFVRHALAAFLLAVCIVGFLDGRYWNIVRCSLAWFVFLPFSIHKKWAGFAFCFFALTLWLSLPYRYLFSKPDATKNLNQMKNRLGGSHFYLPEHENMMRWKLLNRYDTSVHVYDFDLRPFNNKPYPYYDSLRFHPGWFILSRQDNPRSNQFLNYIDSLQSTHFFDSTLHSGSVSAYYFSNAQQYNVLKKEVLMDKRRRCNCDETGL